MFVVYTPKGGEPEQYDASTLKVSEASIVQRTVDMKWQEILRGLEQDDLEAMRGIVWVMKKRSTPTLRFGDFDPGVNEMTTRMDKGEIERWIDNMLVMADEDLEWASVQAIVAERVGAAALDAEHALTYLASKAPDPKDPTTPAEGEEPGQPETQPQTAASEDQSPSPTSPEPETPTSDSSPMSSTSHPEASTTSSSATSTT
ncbi:hypothetical protein ACFY3G_02625 [Streptomyces phaeochromogenes]|uniref:hypothetical protein n=1 Tax=Streptomyces phaeochromogenes TaxID=1923 RepID=UPI003683D39B